jgi:hypothetical protein
VLEHGAFPKESLHEAIERLSAYRSLAELSAQGVGNGLDLHQQLRSKGIMGKGPG